MLKQECYKYAKAINVKGQPFQPNHPYAVTWFVLLLATSVGDLPSENMLNARDSGGGLGIFGSILFPGLLAILLCLL
jgi:hypothetical protein